MPGAIGVALLAQPVSASDETATPVAPVDALCAIPGDPIADEVFQGVLVFSDRHGNLTFVEGCPDRVFNIDWSAIDWSEQRHAELRQFLAQQMLKDRFAAAVDIRADFEPNLSAQAAIRYPGTLKLKEILAFRPTERPLTDFLDAMREAERQGKFAPSSP